MDILLGIVIGIAVSLIWRWSLPQGHSIYGVKNKEVQDVVAKLISKYTTIKPFIEVDECFPIHQRLFTGGTVIAYYDDVKEMVGIPNNVRSLVVWGTNNRVKAADELVSNLKSLGYAASTHEPMPDFPKGTFILVVSDAFSPGCGIGFRPHGIKMALLSATAGKSKNRKA